MDIMNIYAKEGGKVIFLGYNGYDDELAHAKKILEIGKEYTVYYTEIYGWSSTVCLKEFPSYDFNTVMFKDA